MYSTRATSTVGKMSTEAVVETLSTRKEQVHKILDYGSLIDIIMHWSWLEDKQRRPSLPSGLLVSCPMLCALMPGSQQPGANGGPVWQHVPLPISKFSVTAKGQISMAFVSMELICSVPVNWPASYLEFVLPKSHSTTVTDLTIESLDHDRVFATAVIPLDEIKEKGYGVNMVTPGPPGYSPPQGDQLDPELLSLLLPNRCRPGDQFRVRLSYFHALAFEAGSYVMRLPTEVPLVALPPGSSSHDVLEATVAIMTGSALPVDYFSLSNHGLCKGVTGPGLVTLSLQPGPSAFPNEDLAVGFKIWGSDIAVSLNVNPPPQATPNDPDSRGSFVISIAPPSPEHTKGAARSLVFVLDRSGSMQGEPMEFAKLALLYGLDLLSAGDEFNVVAFDHEQMWFSHQMMTYSPNNIAACSLWITSQVEARGLTDIQAPLAATFQLLRTAKGLPFIFLITDGCVQDERDICNYIEKVTSVAPSAEAPSLGGWEQAQQWPIGVAVPRVSTFAIGPYANHFFLKQLATYGKGAFDVAFRPHGIKAQIQRMLLAAQSPVMYDVTLNIPDIVACELYPYPIPDLYSGMPLLIAGKYEGSFPPNITVNGTLPDRSAWLSPPVLAGKDMGLPLEKIFIKSRLDLMTSSSWLQSHPQKMVDGIVDLSVVTGVPCVFTRTVGFETTHAKYEDLQQQRQQFGPKKLNIAAIAIGGAAGIAIIAGVGAALAFGDLGATMSNASGFLDGGLDTVTGCCGDGDCGDCCGDCDVGSCMDGAMGACSIS